MTFLISPVPTNVVVGNGSCGNLSYPNCNSYGSCWASTAGVNIGDQLYLRIGGELGSYGQFNFSVSIGKVSMHAREFEMEIKYSDLIPLFAMYYCCYDYVFASQDHSSITISLVVYRYTSNYLCEPIDTCLLT